MMLADGNFRVAHVSTHVPLRQACDLVRKARIGKVIELAHRTRGTGDSLPAWPLPA